MNNELYFVEHCYEKGMTTSDIHNMLSNVVEGKQEIWADSAEPRLIDELYRLGWNIRPVVKGKDSINFGIQVMQNYKINIHKSLKTRIGTKCLNSFLTQIQSLLF